MSNPNTHPTAYPKPWRTTPLIHSTTLSQHAGCQIFLKLENLQPSGSFKSRGIGAFLLAHLRSTSDPSRTHFYISSGGNAGLACVHAATTLSRPATVVVPVTSSAYMIAKIRTAGARDVLQHGASWVEADTYLREVVMVNARERGEEPVYVHPFDDAEVWSGHASMVPEIVEEVPGDEGPDVMVCSVGGGGLFAGIMQGLESAGLSSTRVLAVETHGAHSLALSLQNKRLSTLPAITSRATSLGARTVASKAFEYAQRANVTSVVLDDRVAEEGCVRFADDERIMVEMACGVCLALCYGGRLKEWVPDLTEETRVVVVVCGGSNVSAGMLAEWAGKMEGNEK